MTLSTAKKLTGLFLCTTILFAALFLWKLLTPPPQAAASPGAAGTPPSAGENEPAENLQPHASYTDEQKIAPPLVLDPEIKARERQNDHPGSRYFSDIDFYHAKSTETLTLLEQFETYQQTGNETCGPACVMMVLNYYGKLGDWNEETLYNLPTDHTDIHDGLCLEQMMEIFDKIGGFELKTTYDYRKNSIDGYLIQDQLKKGVPVIVGWNDRGGHWQVVIGYDDMGTTDLWDDVLILADPADDTDHNQDGYYVYSMQRFLSCFAFYDMQGVEGHKSDRCFIAPRLAE